MFDSLDNTEASVDQTPKGKAMQQLLFMLQSNPKALAALGPAALPYLKQLIPNIVDPKTAAAAQSTYQGLGGL